MSRKILVNVLEPEECRIAVLKDGLLDEFYVERPNGRRTLGNVYKGRVINVEPGIQAAFVDLGEARNGFLHASDCTPDLRGGDGPRSRPPPIQSMLHPGQELLVQVTREGIGNKGPTLTTYVSLPGRYVVLMPALARRGISRKIQEEEERDRLREILEGLSHPDDLGVIVRTAGSGRSRDELADDLRFVRGEWDAMLARCRGAKAPLLVHRETDLITRTLRDVLRDDVTEILVDGEAEHERAREMLEALRPGSSRILTRHDEPVPLFHRYGLETQIEELFDRSVQLPSGGHLVIERTEALVAIDVNSGRMTAERDLEETAFRTDMEAAPEICRQLRLRDLGGVIIIDFIDVREPAHRRRIERRLRECLTLDRARIRVARMSEFGIVEMTRQRLGPGLESRVRRPCPVCEGSGRVPTMQSVSLKAIREIRSVAHRREGGTIVVEVESRIAEELMRRRAEALEEVEAQTGCRVEVRPGEGLGRGEVRVRSSDRL
jgi:ribonuclease E